MSNGIGGTAPGRSAKRKRFCARLASMVIILAFVLVVVPDRAHAAYPTSFTAPVQVTLGPTSGNWILDESQSAMPWITVYSYGSVRMQASWADQDLYADGYLAQGVFRGYIAASVPATTNWDVASYQIIIEDISFLNTAISQGSEHYYNGNVLNFRTLFMQLNQRGNAAVSVNYKVIACYAPKGSTRPIDEIYNTKPTVTANNLSFLGEFSSLESFLPDLQRIRQALLDPTTGWLPTMNTNLQSLVTNQITTNSWLNTQSSQLTQVNSHLAGVRSNQTTEIANQQTMIARQNEIIDNQESQINQLQVIVDYVNNTQAANVVADANDTFVNNAGALESGQADLENAADASLAAVDFSKVGLISSFSQSVNWWMRCVNFLPTGTGAIWDVLVFGFLIAFVMFILRLVR